MSSKPCFILRSCQSAALAHVGWVESVRNIVDVVQVVEHERGRPVRVVPYADLAPHQSLWLATASNDYLLYSPTASLLQQETIVLEALAHVLLNSIAQTCIMPVDADMANFAEQICAKLQHRWHRASSKVWCGYP